MNSNRSLWVFMGPYLSFRILMGLYRSLCVIFVCCGSFLVDPYVSLWVFLRPSAFLLVVMGVYASLWVLRGPYATLWVLMSP